MKEITKYKCEYCGFVFDEKELCEKCEAAHEIPVEIKEFVHCQGQMAHSNYPYTILVKFQNGASIVYKKG